MSEILDLLRSTWSLLFSSVAGAERLRAEWVVTLLALLELVRLGQARARQADLFGEIVIERNAVSVHEPARLAETDEESRPDADAAVEALAAEAPRDPMPGEDAPRAAATPPPDDEPRTEQGEPLNA
jgi:chromatin segregation and condensation protein Rec8/ScpA/Scc1 (kleisin family)